MKKVSLFFVIASLMVACGTPSTDATAPTVDSTAVDSTAVDTTAVIAPDTTVADTACNC